MWTHTVLPDSKQMQLILCAAVYSLATGCSVSSTSDEAVAVAPDRNCTVIAHRGASAYRPEHTPPAYQLAVSQGADFLEPDVVLTKDGVPVVRHESYLSLTTDVATRPEFADRRKAQVIKDKEVDDWFSEDFTAQEYATLFGIERYPELRPDSARFNGRFPVANLQQVIDLWLSARISTGRDIGLYPELKQVAYFEERGLDHVQIMVDLLNLNGLTSPDDDVVLQSFEAPALQRLNEMTELPLVQLLRNSPPEELAAATSFEAMAKIAEYADGVGAPKSLVFVSAEGASPQLTPLVKNAHAAGLMVHVYTFRDENKYLWPEYQIADQMTGDLAGQMQHFLEAGIDGMFTDNPDIGRAVCDEWAGN